MFLLREIHDNFAMVQKHLQTAAKAAAENKNFAGIPSITALESSKKNTQQLENNPNEAAGLIPNPLVNNPDAKVFCLTWQDDFDIDTWWTHSPDWEEDWQASNVTHSCFRRVDNPDRLDFVRKVYGVQYQHGNCSRLQQKHIINSGYGASFGVVLKAFLATMLHNNFTIPFTMTKHWDGAVWLYATTDNTSWAYCGQRSMTCYLLPLTHCQAQYRSTETDPVPNYREDAFGRVHNMGERPETSWLRRYMNRYRKVVRKKVMDTLHNEYPVEELPCTAMHVRRGDAGLPRYPFRRYAAVSEYLQAGQVQPGENIVLLT